MENLTGASEELKFWERFVKTERFLNGWVAKGKTPELRQEVADFLAEHVQPNERVLDVGSGVVSILNGLPHKITALDPLGDEYAKIFDYDKYEICQPLPYTAEEQPFKNCFKVVHMSNAIDHSVDPVIAYESLMEAVRPDGFLIIQGFFNEGTHEGWKGMHQWNIYVEGKCLMLESKKGDKWIIDENPYKVSVYEIKDLNKMWYIWIKAK